jgi:cytochrome c oxidase cbb3-type subunit III
MKHGARKCRSLAALGMTALLLAGCKEERRKLREVPPGQSPSGVVNQSELLPGNTPPPDSTFSQYGNNAYALSNGRRLFNQMNCVGCHAQGGGAIGPALIDATWIYGSDPAQIFQTIVGGRPNGMPAFGSKLANQEVWQLVAYVRSLSGLEGSTVSSARDEHMYLSPNLQLRPKEKPKNAMSP